MISVVIMICMVMVVLVERGSGGVVRGAALGINQGPIREYHAGKDLRRGFEPPPGVDVHTVRSWTRGPCGGGLGLGAVRGGGEGQS